MGLKQEQSEETNANCQLLTCIHAFTQNIPLGFLKNKNKKKSLLPLYDQKTHFPSLVSSFWHQHTKIRERGVREKLTRDWHKLVFVYKRDVTPSKANQKCSIFSSGFYYYYYSTQSIFKYFLKVFWHLHSVLKWKIGFYHTCQRPASWLLAELWRSSGGRMEIHKISAPKKTPPKICHLWKYAGNLELAAPLSNSSFLSLAVTSPSPFPLLTYSLQILAR